MPPAFGMLERAASTVLGWGVGGEAGSVLLPALPRPDVCGLILCPACQFLEAGSAQGGESPIAFPGMRGYLSNSGVKNQGAGGSDHISKSASPKTLWFWIPSA